MDIKREFLLTEEECDTLISILDKAADRCRPNAANTRNGYGKATSRTKEKEWLEKAGEYTDLIDKFREPWI